MNSLRDPHPVVDLRGEISCYDSNGNLTTDENNFRFVYDAWNKVVQVKNSSNVAIVTYGSDALHRHVTDTVGSTVTDRFFSSDWQLLETKVGSNTVTRNVWSPVYVDGLVLRDRDTDANGTLDERLYAHQDANWNTTALVNSSGTVQERYTYTPFGQVTFRDSSGSTLSSSAKDWVFLHQGGEKIAAGNFEFRNRFYSPSLGRWLSNDPLGFDAGDQNWYRAIGNNPGNGGDPEGLIATFNEPVISRIGPDGMSIDPDQPYFAPSGDWFGDFSNYSAGLGDTVSIGITKRIRTWVGYDDVVNYDSGAYAGGQYTGTAVNVGLGVVNPCALVSAVAIPVRLINAGQAIGGTINAGENIANGNYWEAGFDLVGVAGNASQVFRPCFAAGTPVRTATGSILIENLKVGDIVLSRNEFDPEGQVGGKIVEDVFVRSAPILNVVVQGRIIRTTAEHPFWVDGRGWTAAGELKAGDNLLTADKSKLPVESVSESGDTETVYNFRVADWHTYFVGNEDWDFEVWVHNACGGGAQASTGTVWDRIKPTQEVWPGTEIPRSFELATQGGTKIWVHGNATEHLFEHVANMVKRPLPPDLVRVGQQAQLTSLEAAVNATIGNGVPFNQIIQVGGWELKFAPPRMLGDLPALIHALPFG